VIKIGMPASALIAMGKPQLYLCFLKQLAKEEFRICKWRSDDDCLYQKLLQSKIEVWFFEP